MFLSSPSAPSQQRTSWWILFVMCCISILLMQAAHAKERIRYHINGPDGSTLRVVDQKGVAVAAYRYAPFGEQLASKKPHNLHGQQGFVSGVHERNDLVYLKHRYYNPRIGRFYQPDPVTFLSGGIGQINRYQYGWNDPLTFKDPNGMQSTGQWLDDQAMAAVSGTPDGSINWKLYGWSVLKQAHNVFGFEDVSLATDGQSYSKTGLGLSLVGFLPAAKLGKLGELLKFNPCGCFDDDTPIATPQGLKRIIDLKVGDLVLAKDEKTGKLAYQPITQHFTIPSRQIYLLSMVDPIGKKSVLEVSDDHPFWVIGRGWVKSVDLKVGLQLINHQQQVITVTGLVKTNRIETTYNLEVDQYHTFFAGEQKVWVHNTGPCDVALGNISAMMTGKGGRIHGDLGVVRQYIMDLGYNRAALVQAKAYLEHSVNVRAAEKSVFGGHLDQNHKIRLAAERNLLEMVNKRIIDSQ